MNDALDRIIAEIKAELPRSLSLHPPEEWERMSKTGMMYQVDREIWELWTAIKNDDLSGPHGILTEGIHCMIVLARLIAELRRRERLLKPSA